MPTSTPSAGVIQFTCPSCQVKLTVPESMAGVSGPCPRCAAPIQAPNPVVEKADPPAPTEPPPVLLPPPPARSPLAKGRLADELGEIDIPRTLTAPERILPGPRQSAERRIPVAARHSTRDPELRPQSAAARKGRRGELLTPGRLLLPVLLSAASAAVVYLLLYYFLPGGPHRKLETAETAPRPSSPSPATSDKIRSGTTLPKFGTGVPGNPAPVIDSAMGIRAGEVLDQFLAASNLTDRLALIDPPLPPEQLARTLLAGPLPEVAGVASDPPVHHSLENFTDFPFRVTFRGGEGSSVEYLVLVRTRAEENPKIVIEPFLDLVGGRLDTFAAAPVEGPATFRAVIEALPRCFEEGVPSPERKFTYKLCGSTRGTEAARAYASLSSALAEQLYSESGIRFGVPIRATVTLQWNLTEDPERPFIELTSIRSLDWNS